MYLLRLNNKGEIFFFWKVILQFSSFFFYSLVPVLYYCSVLPSLYCSMVPVLYYCAGGGDGGGGGGGCCGGGVVVAGSGGWYCSG